MKRIAFLILSLTLLVFYSCEKNGGKSSYVFPPAPYVGQAVRYTNVEIGADIQFVSFTEGGTYLLCRKPDAQKPKQYKAGGYTVDDEGVYHLTGYGTVKKGGTKAQATEELTFTPTEGEPVTIPCTMELAGESGDLFRQWKVVTTRVKFSGDMTIAADFDGCDLNQICSFLKTNGVIDRDSFPAGQKVSLVDISGLGEIAVLYENGNVDVATITQYGISALNYVWAEPGMGYEFEIGKAVIEYDGDTCIFSVLGQFKGNGKTIDIKLMWALKEK